MLGSTVTKARPLSIAALYTMRGSGSVRPSQMVRLLPRGAVARYTRSVSVLAVVAVLAELCGAPPGPAPVRDPDDSAAYTAVGDDARAAGDLPTAAIAYRKALALDPENRRATAGLAALCGDAASDGPTLLDAIARYRAGDRAAARTALSEIVRGNGSSSTTAGAHFFLGLIALEQHDTGAAVRELELARADPEYRALAAALLRLAHRDGALAVALLVVPELDTNPQLVPDTPPLGAVTGAPAIDEDLLTIAAVTARPVRWLVVRDALTWRKQSQLSALDFLANDLELATELAEGRHRAAIRYDLDYDLLGGARYLVANRATVAYRHDGAPSSRWPAIRFGAATSCATPSRRSPGGSTPRTPARSCASAPGSISMPARP